MRDTEVDLGAMTVRYGCGMDDIAEPLLSLIKSLEDDIARLEGTRLSRNPQWRIFVRLVCAAFDAYLGNATAIHAKAV